MPIARIGTINSGELLFAVMISIGQNKSMLIKVGNKTLPTADLSFIKLHFRILAKIKASGKIRPDSGKAIAAQTSSSVNVPVHASMAQYRAPAKGIGIPPDKRIYWANLCSVSCAFSNAVLGETVVFKLVNFVSSILTQDGIF